MEDDLILVYYISVVGIEEDKIKEFIHDIQKRISTQSKFEKYNTIFIPVIGETRVECINPKYITDSNLIKKHERLMSELHEHLNNQITNIK